jgi:hypothetical protein
MDLERIPDGSGGSQDNVFGARASVLRGRTRGLFSRGVFLMAVAGISTGCYTTAPLAAPPTPGQVLVMELNDNGRARLGPDIGASATKVEGLLDSRTDSAYVVKVQSVVYMNGSNQKWTNEPLTIQSDLVRELRERKFSKSRTALFAGGTVGLAAALIATRSLFIAGSPENQKPPGPGEEQ